MQPALHVTTQVLSGKIEIQVPEAEEGDTVDVFVILSQKHQAKQSKRSSIIELLEGIHAKRPPKSAEEIDRQLKVINQSCGI